MKTVQAPKQFYKMYINGEFVESVSGRWREVIDPATGTGIAKVPEGSSEDAKKAISAARAAFDIEKNDRSKVCWRWMLQDERSRYLREVARLIRERADLLATLEVMNNGKPLAEARGDIAGTAALFDQYANWAGAISGKNLKVGVPDLDCSVYYEPIGVCAGITPWNYPLYIAAWKIAPALATGNSVVLKPSELTPLTTLTLAEIFHDAKIPPGVVNILTGTGFEVGTELTENPDVDKVAFTGGPITGAKIGEISGRSLKRCSLELGGKSAQIVFSDADLEKAVEGVILGIFTNQGEVCSAGSRVLVEESVHSVFVEKLMSRVRSRPIRLGHGLDPETQMGPLISEAHRVKVLLHIENGKKEGARLLLGGKIPGQLGADPKFGRGFFVEPTIFDGVTPEMSIASEEIFGPVLSIMTFSTGTDSKETETNAIRMANRSEYGLAAGVWTQNGSRAVRVTEQLDVGIVWINTYDTTLNELPWGGRKKSGHGSELGWEGLQEYLQPKQVIRFVGF